MIELTKQTTIGEVPIVVRKEGSLTEGRWLAEIYDDFKKIGEPSKKWFEGMPLLSTKEFIDFKLNFSLKCGDRKVVLLSTNVLVDEDYDCEVGLQVDDAGCVYVNDEWVAKINGKSDYTVMIFSLKKGWNKIEIVMWNGTGGDGILFQNKLSFDDKIKKIQYDISEKDYSPTITQTLEDNIHSVSIKPIGSKPNYFSTNLLSSDLFYTHEEASFFTMPAPQYGGIRYRIDHDFEYVSPANYKWYYTKVSESKYRAFLLKPNTKYTLTYYVYEYINEIDFFNNGHPTAYVWVGDTYHSYSKTPGMHTMTITTDRTAGYNPFSPLRMCYHAEMQNVVPEGVRRVIDIELISMVEGEEPELKNTAFFSSVGGEKGFSVYTQDYEVRLGNYTLEGDIPDIIGDIDNRIEKKNNEFNITWI